MAVALDNRAHGDTGRSSEQEPADPERHGADTQAKPA
jgi:hypothetical protein